MYQPSSDDFPWLAEEPDYAYLDTAATCLVPTCVRHAVDRYLLDTHANAHRGSYARSRAATEKLEQGRQTLARWFQVQPEQLAFAASTTQALNDLAQALPIDWQAGDEILLSIAEHHANLLPWQRLAQRFDLKLRFIELTPEGDLAAPELLLNERTRVVAVSAASNVTGAIYELGGLLSAARQRGVVSIVDAAQLAPHQPRQLGLLDADAVVCSAHKFYGVTGLGLLLLAPQFAEQLEPFRVGGGIVTRVTREQADYLSDVHRFEAGTPNTLAVVAAATATEWLDRHVDLSHYLETQRTELNHSLAQREWLRVLPAGPTQTPTLSFASSSVHAQDIAAYLDSQRIEVRSGHHCAQPLLQYLGYSGVVRIALGAYTTPRHLERLVSALDEAYELFS
ncbi:aminotransferase class V-fold PLP-dependent enzyme [Pseudidiomarina aestuarii]|uniref:aminotransferase class V-fold PLP-dependent enzyme n=1 Tax=Pseudidiomarina aestuarii TaxID=624146 RepID=UPI003A983962